MKRTFFSTMKLVSLVLVAAASLMTACEEEPEEVVGRKLINIKPTIENYTKATDTAFENGDAVGLHVFVDKIFLNNAKYTCTDGKFVAEQNFKWYEDDSVPGTLMGYYPYDANAAYNSKGYNLKVNTNQSSQQSFKQADFMVGTAISQPTSNAVEIPFRHALSKVVYHFAAPEGEVVESVTVSGLYNEAYLKLKDGSITTKGGKQTITPAKVTVDGKEGWAFIALPQKNATVNVEVITASGRRFPLTSTTTYESGKAYVAEVALTQESIRTQFTTTVTDWVVENEGTMEFDRIENDTVIRDIYGINDIDPSLEWPLTTTLPSLVSPEMATDFVVVVNTQGTSITPGEKLYAHTGVLTDQSSSTGDWKYVKHDWAVDADDCLLTHVGNGIYGLVITGGARAFYGVPEGEVVTHLAFVFRTSGGTKEVKNDGKDILVELVDASDLVVSFVSPANGEIVSVGDKFTVKVVALNAKSIELSLNGSVVESVENDDEIVYEHTVTAEGDMLFEATAYDKDGASATEQVMVAALGSTQSAARPAGVKDGVTVEGSEATFVLFAPGKEKVVLLGEFNDFAPSNEYLMKRDGDYFWTTVSGLKADTEYAYQYLVDGKIRVGDPYCEKILDPWNDSWINYEWVNEQKVPKAVPVYPDLKEYPTNTTDVVSVFSTTKKTYNWQVADFERPNRHSLVIYELLIRDFTEEGSIDAVTAKLDYLETLGVNAIELMPIHEFDGNNSWGYNPCFYFAADKAYGTKEDYKEFIDECHKRGIAVILDVVFNHATGQFPWAKMWWDSSKNCTTSSNPFFNVEAKHNFNVYHDFNHSYAKTRSYFKEVLQFWLKEYNIDGYRFDLTKGIVQNPSNYDAGGYSAERIGWLKGYADAIREVEDDAYIIFEHFCDSSEENELAAYEGIMLWNNGAMTAMQESAMGWHESGKSNFSNIRTYGRINFAESHDEERVAFKMTKYGNGVLKTVESAEAASQLSGLYALEFLSPYPKMIWQFGELAYDYSIDYNDRTGEKPVAWTLGYYENTHRKALYNNLSKVISWRTDHPAIFSHDGGNTQCKIWNVGESAAAGKTLVLSNDDGAVIVVANQTTNQTKETTINVPQTGEWTNIITGEKVTLGSTYKVTLKPHEFIALGKAN